MTRPRLVLDYETFSEANLKKVGGYEYARHPSTRIICAAWRFGKNDEELRKNRTKVWAPPLSRLAPPDLLSPLLDPETELEAHNALFEQLITRFVLPRYVENEKIRALLGRLPIKRWDCTAARAAAQALPRKLESVGAALKLPVQKDMPGHRVMLKLSKPRKPTKNNPSTHHNKKSDLLRTMDYCVVDVDSEVELSFRVPKLPPEERRIWLLDQETNMRGVAVDRELILNVLGHVKTELANYDSELFCLTNGRVKKATNRADFLKELHRRGLRLPNMQAKTVKDAAKRADLPPEVRRLLEIRQATSKTSTAKYVALELYSRTDSRIRDLLVYHGGSTGRWTARGPQIHNVPRGSIEDQPLAAELVREADLETVRLLYGEPMELFSSILRSSIRATPGHEIFCGDFSAIEVRVLFWLAGHAAGLRAYKENRDIYREMAQVVYNVKKLDDVTKPQREIGKRIILGCGYGMGWRKFAITCEQFGVEIDEALAQKSVTLYRQVHHPIKSFWYALEEAAIRAVQNPGKRYRVGRVVWYLRGKWLHAELPSGRSLYFYGPEIKMEKKPWGDVGPTLWHWDIDPKTKRWIFTSTYGGKLCENLCQGCARDIMSSAALRLRDLGYYLLFSVHDELVNEREKGEGSTEEYERVMSARPTWAEDLPLKVEVWSGERYRK